MDSSAPKPTKSKKKPKSKKKGLLGRARTRKRRQKSKQKPIGLRNAKNAKTDTSTTAISDGTAQTPITPSKATAHTTSPNGSSLGSSASSNSSIHRPKSSKSMKSVKSINDRKRQKKAKSAGRLGIDPIQMKKQQDARKKEKTILITRTKRSKFARTGRIRLGKADIQQLRKGLEAKGLTEKDMLPLRDYIDLESDVHCIRHLGTHKIHIHATSKDKGLLCVNGSVDEFKSLKVIDILEIKNNAAPHTILTLKISKIEESKGRWSLSIDEQIASQWTLCQGMLCSINFINPLSLELKQVTVTFRNQYISRSVLVENVAFSKCENVTLNFSKSQCVH